MAASAFPMISLAFLDAIRIRTVNCNVKWGSPKKGSWILTSSSVGVGILLLLAR
jgi:hypothetical protein